MTRRQWLPWLALGIIYVVWGSTYMAIRIVVRDVPPVTAACIRFLVAGVIMALVAAVADRGRGRPTARQLADYAVIGILLLGFGNALVMWSERRIPSSIAALIVATVPLWLTLVDGLRPGGQRWTWRAWIGTAIGFAGVAFLVRPSGGVEAGHWPAILALQAATLCWTVGALYSQSLQKKLPVFSAAAVEMLAAGIFLFVGSRLLGEKVSGLAAAPAEAWWALLYLVVFGSLIGFTAFAYCLDELPASTVGTYAYVNPVVAVALGAFFLDEPLSAGLLVGGLLILVAVILTTTQTREPAAPCPDAPAASSRDRIEHRGPGLAAAGSVPAGSPCPR
jgi:drug/metabolite transporter (DMT)-like permease